MSDPSESTYVSDIGVIEFEVVILNRVVDVPSVVPELLFRVEIREKMADVSLSATNEYVTAVDPIENSLLLF